jgi:hypothetical protein
MQRRGIIEDKSLSQAQSRLTYRGIERGANNFQTFICLWKLSGSQTSLRNTPRRRTIEGILNWVDNATMGCYTTSLDT